MKRQIRIFAVVLTCLLASAYAFAQGGGASTTGSINGKIADSSGAVLPGVTVTSTSPSLMGVQTAVSDTSGNYRFPALPPGTYTVTFELPGFNTLKRENIQISMGFTATVNVELQVASVQETVTVTGDSPVIDTSNTRVQQNFKLEALQEIPNARDMWSLLAVTPAVQMSRIDVGGNRAGTQTGYTAYGYSGQNRVLVEGINTTEGTSGAGFYFDYGSFEEVFLGTIGQGAEMPTPGVQSQFLGKSGGNKFQGEIYQDFENNSFQGGNIPADVVANGIRDHSNEIAKYRDFNINVGGPIRKDKVWWYFSHRDQFTSVQQPNFIGPLAGKNFDTHLWNPSGKVTYQINQNNKLIGYYQWGQKVQPNRTPSSSYSYTDSASTFTQNSGSWVYKGEWNGTISSKLYAEARYGVFGYYFPLIANSDTNAPEIIDNSLSQYFNADEKEQTDRHRGQLTGALTYFKDSLAGTHSIKIGGEYLMENQYVGYLQVASGNLRETIGTNGKPTTIAMYAPTATAVGGVLSGPHGDLLSVANVTTGDAFITDQWTVGRATMNLGLRYDRYRGWTPDQTQLAHTFPTGVSIPATTIPQQTYFTWNKVVPRLGLSYDIAGDGKTVLKLNYGRYGFNPGPGIASSANPNQSVKSLTYAWTDTKLCASCIPGDGTYEPGEEGNLTASALNGNIQVDPNLFQPMSTQATAYVERQISEGVGARVGFVYFTVNDQIETMQTFRPASAYTVPFSVVDSATNQSLTFYGIPNSQLSPVNNYPTTQVVTNVPENGKYKTFEASVNKRQGHGFSAGGGFGYTWSHDFPLTYPNTPNGPFDYDYTTANFKGNAQYSLPWGDVLLSAVYRFQLGSNYARTLSVSAPASCNCTFGAARGGSLSNTTVYATQYNAYRNDNISVLDLRGEKTVSFSQVKLRLFVDGFNLLNQYAAETISVTTGVNFQRPTAILGPRTARVGFRFIW
jgi:Carboxypeptidase regulatory-like domain